MKNMYDHLSKGILLGVLCLASCSNSARSEQEPPMNRYKAVFTSIPQEVPTIKTPDAPLAGNGDIGITMGGAPDSLCFYIGKNDFWRAYPVYPGGIALPGGLSISSKSLQGAGYYAEQLPGSAEIKGRFTKEDLQVELSAWVAATHNHVVIELTANEPIEINLNLWAAQGNTSVTAQGKEDIHWVSRSFENTPLLRWPTHVILAMNTPGSPLPHSDRILLQPGEKRWITGTAYTNHDTPQWKDRALSEAGKLTPTLLKELKKEHQQWWNNFWNESSVAIGDEELERYYYMSQYLLACSSRGDKFAPGIWGTFVTRDEAAWGGDYHLNYNYQAPYWAAFSSNHIDLTKNFDQPLLDYMDMGRRHARELLNCKGIYYPVGIGPKGLCTSMWPLTPDEMMQKYATRENTIDNGYKFLGQKINAVFSVGNMLMRHYSTYDEAYAKEVYPYIIACADFWEDYLVMENGRYVIKMDHFNEVMPNKRNKGVWRNRLGDFNSTLSLGLVKMLFKGVTDMSIFLQTDEERREKWNEILTRLSDYPVGKNTEGRMSLKSMERGPQNSEVRPSGLNRVSIHGLILPGGVAGPVTDSVFNAILLEDVNHWTDRQRNPDDWGNTSNNGIETCYPGAVRVGYDAEKLLQHLKRRISFSVHPNLWITQGGGGIETLAAVPLTINEMLMQSYEGVIRIFPNWIMTQDASFKDLRAYGAFLVSSSLKNGTVEMVEIKSEKGRTCVIDNPWKGKEVRIVRNGKDEEVIGGSRFTIDTKEGETVKVLPARGGSTSDGS